MKFPLFILFLLFSITSKGQSSYSGHLGKLPITLVMYHYSDGVSLAYYVYNKYDNPIIINGNLKNEELKLLEKDKKGNTSATLIFENFKESDTEVTGKWINADSTKTYQILLKKDFDVSYGDDIEWKSRELIQSNTTKKHYFKTIITKEKGNFYARVSGIKIFKKKTDKLIQTIELDCQLFGIDNVSIGDYNFDGIEDFSVFEASYAGPNTSSIYILRTPNSNNYFKSSFSGTSLIFDNESKLIHEHNQCCAGRIHMNATYKVVNNEMVLISQKCIEYNDDKEEFIDTKCQ
ncbi:XAC2610-related protein [Tenacibaculum sp. SDUM215027]|uniref:XAC2610-related protein n=1 Tax=Tenacibaculum sp. SDUM215027 TaxID=3422596 RepID=UPI003D3138E5